MNSILSGIALMLFITVIAGVGLKSQFSESSDTSYQSEYGTVRLD